MRSLNGGTAGQFPQEWDGGAEQVLFVVGQLLGDGLLEPRIADRAFVGEPLPAGVGEFDPHPTPVAVVGSASDEPEALDLADGGGDRLRLIFAAVASSADVARPCSARWTRTSSLPVESVLCALSCLHSGRRDSLRDWARVPSIVSTRPNIQPDLSTWLINRANHPVRPVTGAPCRRPR